MSTTPVSLLPTADLVSIIESFRRAGETIKRAFAGMHGDPERALNRRLMLTATLHLDRALKDARKTLDLRNDPDLATLPSETRLYVSARLDPYWTEDVITESAAWMIRYGFHAREVQALLEGWADRCAST